jgi:hypothetical protein
MANQRIPSHVFLTIDDLGMLIDGTGSIHFAGYTHTTGQFQACRAVVERKPSDGGAAIGRRVGRDVGFGPGLDGWLAAVAPGATPGSP